MVLWLRKQFSENCRKKTPGVARFTLQVQKHFKNRKNWQQKLIPIDDPMDIQIAIIITPTKLLADSPRKIRSIPNFLLFYYPQTPFHRTSLRDTISIENEKFLRNFFPTSCSFGSVECCMLTHADERICRKDGKVTQMPFFFFCCTKKSFSMIVLWNTFGQPARNCRQEDETSSFKPENRKKTNEKFSQEKSFNSANWSFCSSECCFVNSDEV